MKNEKGFTLAEVLITLVIIGVVAAFTIPSVNIYYRNVALQSQLKKTYSELAQLARLFYIDNGMTIPDYSRGRSEWEFLNKISSYIMSTPILASGQGKNDGIGNYNAYYTLKYLNGKKYSGGANSSGRDSSFMCDHSGFRSSNSGAIYIFNDIPQEGQNGPVICVDINGQKGPNQYGKDYFMFIFTTDGEVLPVGASHKDNPPHCDSSNGSCSNFNNVGANYCSKSASDISKNTSCAYYALLDESPIDSKKSYWHDFI